MKSITTYFDDNEFEILTEVKGEETWHDFIMTLVESKRKK